MDKVLEGRMNGFEVAAALKLRKARDKPTPGNLRDAVRRVVDAMAYPHAENDTRAARQKLAECVGYLLIALGLHKDQRGEYANRAAAVFDAAMSLTTEGG